MMMMSSAAKLKIYMMMKWLLSKLYGHLVHADGEEDGSGGGDVDEDGGPWAAEFLQCTLVYLLRRCSCHIECLAVLDLSPTVYCLPLMEMMATVLV
jgi:hypothetical protein